MSASSAPEVGANAVGDHLLRPHPLPAGRPVVRRAGSDPTNNRLKNLRALCQCCHMLHDRSHHLAQRWITYRRRRALGDLFSGLICSVDRRSAIKIGRCRFPTFIHGHQMSGTICRDRPERAGLCSLPE